MYGDGIDSKYFTEANRSTSGSNPRTAIQAGRGSVGLAQDLLLMDRQAMKVKTLAWERACL